MSKITFLGFEQSIAELDSKIEELRFVQDDSAVDISEEIDRLSQKSQMLTKDIYAKLTPWQVSQISRHPQRPYTLDYISQIFTDFHELHGDRSFADDLAIVGGLARLDGMPDVIGVQSLGDNAVTIRVLLRTQPGDQWEAGREFRRRAKIRLDREGIEIPFPQRTVHVRHHGAVPDDPTDRTAITEAATGGA